MLLIVSVRLHGIISYKKLIFAFIIGQTD